MFQPSIKIPAVFINSHYNVLGNETKPIQIDMYKKYTDQLWEFANRVKPFELQDIKMAQEKIYLLMAEKQNLTTKLMKAEEELEEKKKKIEDLKCTGLFGVLTCSKTWVRVVGLVSALGIGFLLGTIVICSCNNPCCRTCCCGTCWMNCCRKCCQTGM